MLTELIEALQIFAKYGNPNYPTHCEHDVLYVCGIDKKDMSKEDVERLKEIGFTPDNEFGPDVFKSFKFGSA